MNAMERLLAAIESQQRIEEPPLLEVLRDMLPAAEADAAEAQEHLDSLRAEIAKLEAESEMP